MARAYHPDAASNAMPHARPMASSAGALRRSVRALPRRRFSPLVYALAFGACVSGGYAGASVLAPREARGSVAIALSLEDLARAANVIARVTPIDRTSAWENGRIVTYTRLRVDAVVAGSIAGSAREVRVRTFGGTVGDISQLVEGEPAFRGSEPSLVFLVASASDHVVAGRAQGQLVVRRDGRGREVVHTVPVGSLVERRVRPPSKPTGPRIVDMNGAALESFTLDAKRAWEASHGS